MKQLLLCGLLLVNGWAGACSVEVPPPNLDFERWVNLLSKSRSQMIISAPTNPGSSPEQKPVNLDAETLASSPRLTPSGARQFQPCPAEILARYTRPKLSLMACETVNRPFAEVRDAAVKAYKGRLLYQGTNTLKFAGGGGNKALEGDLWNGTQLTLLPQQGKTLLVWQSTGSEVVADRLNTYMSSQFYTFFESHRNFFRSESRPRIGCNAFGIINQDFFKFKECYASEQVAGTMPQLLIRFVLAYSADESMAVNVSYIRIDAGTCGSVFEVFKEKP